MLGMPNRGKSNGKLGSMVKRTANSYSARQKQHRYGKVLRALIADQTAWIRDPRHQRRLTEQNGQESVALAEQADRLAQG